MQDTRSAGNTTGRSLVPTLRLSKRAPRTPDNNQHLGGATVRGPLRERRRAVTLRVHQV